ncbi:MAG: sialate O-acetylesterase [Planctomycetota bacterium]
MLTPFFFVVCLCVSAVAQPFAFDSEFQHSMVLQRGVPTEVRGTAPPGSEVSVSLADQTRDTVADASGRWRAEFPSREASGPFDLVARSGAQFRRRGDLVFGDVWVASGQSNMAWSVAQSDDADLARRQAARLEGVRFRVVPMAIEREPVGDEPGGEWERVSDGAADRVSAVAFNFARVVHERTGVPIGIIQSAWGGSSIESWIPRDAFAENALLASIPSRQSWEDDRVRDGAIARAFNKFFDLVMERTPDELKALTRSADDAPGWVDVSVPGFWEVAVGNYDGLAWLSRDFALSEEQAGSDAVLHLAMVDDFDRVYVNGRFVGQTAGGVPSPWTARRAYPIDASVLRPGTNTVAVHALDGAGPGGIHGEPDDVRLETAAGDVALAGVWRLKLERDRPVGPVPLSAPGGVRNFRYAGGMYNAMIHPLLEQPVAGFLWYQGESNAGRPAEYAQVFPLMIRTWRERWAVSNGDLPFLFVQLAGFQPRPEAPGTGAWPALRAAQTKTLSVPDTAMALALDVGDAYDIHPRDKRTVGERLAKAALAMSYGVDEPYRGPSFASSRRTSHLGRQAIRVSFRDADGLTTIDGVAPRSFAVAGDDGAFRWAEAEIVGNSVVVWAEGEDDPVSVMYAWNDNPEVNLINGAGLPAVPFRTDAPLAGRAAGAKAGGNDAATLYADEGYELVWADEFNIDGPPNPDNWSFEEGFSRNREAQWYQPNNARVDDGLLIIEARRERRENPGFERGSRDWRKQRRFARYTSSSLRTMGKHAWLYGRFEMRGRIDTRSGLWPAWWTIGVPDREGIGWPACGELDIMEYYRGMVLANAAWKSEGGNQWTAEWDATRTPLEDLGGDAWSQQFHTWRMDWDENRIAMYLDGVLLNEVDLTETINPDGTNPFRWPHYMLVNLALGGDNGGPLAETEFPAMFEIDWIRVYQRSER